MNKERLIDLGDTRMEDEALTIRVNTGESLGARLLRQKAEREQTVLDKEKAKEDKRREKIVAWFDKIKQNVVKAAEENKDICPANVPEYVTNVEYSHRGNLIITNAGHKDYSLWVHFTLWCQENELQANIAYNGAGYYGSYQLTISPLEG